MQRWEIRNFKDTAIYWAVNSTTPTDGRGGMNLDDPVEIKCRWNYKQELFVTNEGKEQLSNAVVYVESDVTVNGFMMLGTLDDLQSSAAGPENENAYRIMRFDKTDSLNEQKTVRKVML